MKKYLILTVLLAATLTGCAAEEEEYDSVNMMELPPMKDQFDSYFMMGNIATGNDYSGGKITNQKLLRHYNVLTAENNMKPNVYDSKRSGTTVTIDSWTTADNFVNAATASGFKIVGHTLLWHSQIPGWQSSLANDNSVSAADARAIMESWITQVVTHFKGKIYSWDVLNELFNDGNGSMRDNNPWAKKIGKDFVYYGFLAARNADPDAILYYNDYNLDNSTKATAVYNLVSEVNTKYAQEYPTANRKLIEGIGMQSHHNTGITASRIKTSLDLFKPLGVKISISELDVLCGGYSGTIATTGPSKVTSDADRTKAANLYGEYFKIFLQYSDIIERVTFWGVYDEQSWRSAAEPLPFKGKGTSVSKPAYDKIMQALNEHKK